MGKRTLTGVISVGRDNKKDLEEVEIKITGKNRRENLLTIKMKLRNHLG